MITIDAVLKDGRPALVDLAGASPAGGFVTSESRPAGTMLPGDVVRHHGAWVVVAEVAHAGFSGITTAVLVDQDSAQHVITEAGGSVEVRTDARINPDSLFRLAS